MGILSDDPERGVLHQLDRGLIRKRRSAGSGSNGGVSMADLSGVHGTFRSDDGFGQVIPDELDELFEPGMRRIFRAVAVDRFGSGAMPPHAELLFGPGFGPWDSDRDFLGQFYNEIHHQDTCDRFTAEGVPLLVALAVDGRVRAQERMGLVKVLFGIATETDRHRAEYWPGAHPQADAAAAVRARSAVEGHLPEVLARWDGECLGVRLALAALGVVFRDSPATVTLRQRVEALAGEHQEKATVVGFLRFVMLLVDGTDRQVLSAVESRTMSYWRASHREVPLQARAVHLLDQMLSQVRTTLLARRP
ncbi:hypothetical protein [Kitasatospora sp. NPDC101183]|uniref:hypothetical protein n=1 Tax=Kitasatospora sp. NPDC101183 TaxID=3364100 RepID=UPI0037F77DB8